MTLAQARDKAREARDKIERAVDPVAERQAANAALIAAASRGLIFDKATESHLKAKLDAFKNAKYRQQWENTLTQYALPVLGKIMVQDISGRAARPAAYLARQDRNSVPAARSDQKRPVLGNRGGAPEGQQSSALGGES